MMRIPLLLLVLFLASCVKGEIRSFAGIIEAASSYIHYSDGYLVAPGFVDISKMTFQTLDYVPDKELTDDEIEGEEDDDIDGDNVNPEDGDGGGRLLDEASQVSDGSVVSS